MKVEIDETGMIIISAETPLESFALNEISNKWNKIEDMHKSIIIKAEIPELNKNAELNNADEKLIISDAIFNYLKENLDITISTYSSTIEVCVLLNSEEICSSSDILE